MPITGDPWQGLISSGEVTKAVRPVNVVVVEDESQSLRSFLRAVASNGPQAIVDARNLLSGLDTVVVTRQLLDDAGTLHPPRPRSLDAIHLVAAQRAGDTSAADLGIATASPR